MFGHKSSNQTTVGTAVVQNPSMLDNVSTDDFSGSNESGVDVQQQVQDALNKKEMQTMIDSAASSTPVVASGTFMASPSATPTAVVTFPADLGVPAVVSASDPLVPVPVSDTVVDQVTSGTAEPAVQEVSDADVPRPLSPEENKEIESHPIISSVSSPTSSGSEVLSPSAPIAPPPAPAAVEATTESATTEPAADEPTETTLNEDVPVTPESTSEPTPEVATPAEDVLAEAPAAEEVTVEESTDETDQSSSAEATSSTEDSAPEIDTEKLAGMKQQALEHLEPLVDHLDQSPEEEFRTTMMRIQANDNHTLLERAFDAAKKITDDKERAQAMLDIVNEINYFSQTTKKD